MGAQALQGDRGKGMDGAEAADDDWELLSARRCCGSGEGVCFCSSGEGACFCSSGEGSAAGSIDGAIARSETGPQGGAAAVVAGATMPHTVGPATAGAPEVVGRAARHPGYPSSRPGGGSGASSAQAHRSKGYLLQLYCCIYVTVHTTVY